MVEILDRGRIQTGDRLIQDQKAVSVAQRALRDQNALLLAAGEIPVAALSQMLGIPRRSMF